MLTPGKHAQHTPCILRVTRLAQNFIIDQNNGVGAKNEPACESSSNGLCFFLCQAAGILQRRLARKALFIDVRGLTFKSNTGLAQQILASRGSGSENQALVRGQMSILSVLESRLTLREQDDL